MFHKAAPKMQMLQMHCTILRTIPQIRTISAQSRERKGLFCKENFFYQKRESVFHADDIFKVRNE